MIKEFVGPKKMFTIFIFVFSLRFKCYFVVAVVGSVIALCVHLYVFLREINKVGKYSQTG